MKKHVIFLLFIILFVSSLTSEFKKPTVLVSILVRNKEHTLPYFLSNLENVEYPKERKHKHNLDGQGRLYIRYVPVFSIKSSCVPICYEHDYYYICQKGSQSWARIRSDHNSDQSIPILKTWIKSVKNIYHSIYTEFEDDETTYADEESMVHWTDSRFTHVMNMRDAGLHYARNIWADYLLSIDADVFLTNPGTLKYLISKNVSIVSPMLVSEGLYSNFWHGMTDDYYYLRTDDYKPILHRKNISCFVVPMVHSCVLVDLRRTESDYLTYRPDKIPNFDGPHDDIIVFALSAKFSNIPLHLCNEEHFGYITVPLEQNDGIEHDHARLLNIKMEVLNSGERLHVNDVLQKYIKMPEKDTMMFDKIYMINLERRADRRRRMHRCFDELGLEVETLDAIDGKALNESFLKTLTFMRDFEDPYHKRPMKLGEIGCFLSHYQIWNQVIEHKYQTVLVLEDDIRFEPFFRAKVVNLMDEVRRIHNWNLVYFGRKKLQDQDEPWVEGANYLVEVGYSYWTLGYALSFQGARKLIEARPLSKLVPVDEYLPILFDRHPHENWKRYYPKRDLVAFSAAPLLLYPTHYTGEEGYISDTEDSVVIPETVIVKDDL